MPSLLLSALTGLVLGSIVTRIGQDRDLIPVDLEDVKSIDKWRAARDDEPEEMTWAEVDARRLV